MKITINRLHYYINDTAVGSTGQHISTNRKWVDNQL